jgi:predicted ribosome quality control (RQC) complex YloA/Tae2 family protein
MRKYLRNARLLNVEQHEFERVAVFSFKTYEGNMVLILEVFGNGNIVLLSEGGIILQALAYKQMRDRNVLRGESFKFAPSLGKNPYSVRDEEIASCLKAPSDIEVVRAITRFLSVGGIFAEEVLARANVEKTKPVGQLSDEEIAAIIANMRRLLIQIKEENLEPYIVLDEKGGLVGAAPLKLKRYESSPLKIRIYPTYNEALDEFYSKSLAVDHATEDIGIGELEAEAARIGRIVAEQQGTLSYANAEAEQFRRAGDLIYAHFNDLQTLLDKFLNGQKNGKQWKHVADQILTEKHEGLIPSSFFESFIDKEVAIKVNVEGSTFNLSLQRTLFENAAEFYERGKRVKHKAEGAKTALNEYGKKLKEIKKRITDAKELERVRPVEAIEELEKRKVKPKEWFEKFRWFVSSEGLLVVAGKDAVTNEVLIKKHTEPNDVVFHADIVGAPFVVIKTEGKTPTQQSLAEAGEFAGAFSRAWREGFASVDVYWVKPEQLSKGGPSGESVGHGAFVVRGERNWMRGTPLRIAIGVQVSEEKTTAKIIGGPVGMIKEKTDQFILIVPGDKAGKDLPKLIVRQLVEKTPKNLREIVSKSSPETIREFVPFGKGNVSKGSM